MEGRGADTGLATFHAKHWGICTMLPYYLALLVPMLCIKGSATLESCVMLNTLVVCLRGLAHTVCY